MTPQQLLDWARAVIPLETYDGRPQVTPDGPYAYLATDGGVTARSDLTRAASDTITLYVVCVNTVPAGARWAAQQVRAALNNQKPDGNHPLAAQPAGPELTDGTPTTGGERTSITLTYQLITRTP